MLMGRKLFTMGEFCVSANIGSLVNADFLGATKQAIYEFSENEALRELQLLSVVPRGCQAARLPAFTWNSDCGFVSLPPSRRLQDGLQQVENVTKLTEIEILPPSFVPSFLSSSFSLFK